MDWIPGMRQLPDACIHCGVTSSPYFGQRDYQTEGQLGLEATPEEYIEKLVVGFREFKRIMHPTGTVWLNLGDSYWGGKGQSSQAWSTEHTDRGVIQGEQHQICAKGETRPTDRKHEDYKAKDLMEMPSDVVKALRADGWWLRSRIPWLKRNAMPESTDDRPTQAVEYVFLLTKSGTPQFWTHRDKDGIDKRPKADWRWVNQITQEEVADAPPDWKEKIKCPNCNGTGVADIEFEYDVMGETFLDTQKGECPICEGEKEVQRWKRINLWRGHDYFYDGEAVRVKQIGDFPPDKFGILSESNKFSSIEGNRSKKFGTKWSPTKRSYHPSGRSRRNSDWFFQSWQGLWTDENGEPLAFIVNPKPYKKAHFATFPPGLVIPCIKAGTSEKGCCPECGNPWVRVVKTLGLIQTGGNKGKKRNSHNPQVGSDLIPGQVIKETLGWRPTCSCGKEPVPCLVFDPFAGTGTVIEVARRMGRNGLGFDINPQYVKEFAGERLAQEVLL